jgi:acyl-CoA synthetase (AMP-forming)/AMP-acid ligase II
MTTITQRLRQAGRDIADEIAFELDGVGALTFADWWAEAHRIAEVLHQAGVGPRDRVLLDFSRSQWLRFVSTTMGVYLVGGVAVPLPADLPADAVARCAALADAAVCVSDTSEPGRPRRVDVGPAAPIDLADRRHHGARPPFDPIQPDPGSPADLIFTSGTTADPRMVELSHASLVEDRPEHDPADGPRQRFLVHTALGTAGAQATMCSALHGAIVVQLPAFDARRFCEVAERGVAAVSLVPALARLVVDEARRTAYDFSNVGSVVSSSAPLPRELFDDLAATFPAAEITNVYSVTESGVSLSQTYSDGRHTSVGRPDDGAEVAIRHPGTGAALAAGQPGEVWLRDLRLARRPVRGGDGGRGEGERADDGWVRTGDYGSLDVDGYLHLIDRIDDIIVSGGLNISPVEIEAVLLRHPNVLDAAVSGQRHDVLGKLVVAAVVLRRPEPLDDLFRHCRAHLPPHKVPARISAVPRIARSGLGKVARRTLDDLHRPHEPPATTTESLLASIWSEVLGPPVGDRHANFFELGGHSVALTQVAARLRKATRREVPISLLFENPVLADLGAAVQRGLDGHEFAPAIEITF